MHNHIKYSTKLAIIVLLFFKFYSNAQQNNIVRFDNTTIAVKKQNDTIYLYNSLGELRKTINFENKKVTPFGLPKEVQDIIYNGEIPEHTTLL